MNVLDLKRDVVPVSEFRSNAASLLKRAQEGHKLVLTHNGKAAGVLIGVEQYQEMEVRLKELENTINSLIEIRKGQVMDKDAAMQLIDQEVERAYSNPIRR